MPFACVTVHYVLYKSVNSVTAIKARVGEGVVVVVGG